MVHSPNLHLQYRMQILPKEKQERQETQEVQEFFSFDQFLKSALLSYANL